MIHIFTYKYAKAFLLHLIKAWERTLKQKRRDGEIEEHKLNEMGALNMKQEKWNKLGKSERSSGFPNSSVGKVSACKARDLGLVLGLGRSPGEEKGYHSSILA